MVSVSRYIVLAFGLFFICIAFVMSFAPRKANQILRKAGSTNLINYAEIGIRMIPAAALIIYSDYATYPMAFKVAGYFMLTTSLVLFCIPRRSHHAFSLQSAQILKPLYLRIIAPFAFAIGAAIICCTI